MNDEDARLTPDEEEELIGAVLRRTSGGACGRAEELLVRQGWSLAPQPAEDQPLAADDLGLLDAHLEHCTACAALARSLAAARDTLPSFAAFDPGPAFTAAVFDRTSRAEPATLGEKLHAWWRAWLARPRFAWELAYAATLLILLVGGNPATTLQAASSRTVSAAAAGFDRAREAWPAAVGRVSPTAIELPASVRALGSATSRAVAQSAAATGLSGTWNRVLLQWSVTWDWLRGVASELAGRVSGTFTSIRRTVTQWVSRTGTEPGPPAVR